MFYLFVNIVTIDNIVFFETLFFKVDVTRQVIQYQNIIMNASETNNNFVRVLPTAQRCVFLVKSDFKIKTESY